MFDSNSKLFNNKKIWTSVISILIIFSIYQKLLIIYIEIIAILCFFFFFCIIEIYVYKFCGKNVSMINVMGLNIHKNKHMLAKNVTSTNKII